MPLNHKQITIPSPLFKLIKVYLRCLSSPPSLGLPIVNIEYRFAYIYFGEDAFDDISGLIFWGDLARTAVDFSVYVASIQNRDDTLHTCYSHGVDMLREQT